MGSFFMMTRVLSPSKGTEAQCPSQIRSQPSPYGEWGTASPGVSSRACVPRATSSSWDRKETSQSTSSSRTSPEAQLFARMLQPSVILHLFLEISDRLSCHGHMRSPTTDLAVSEVVGLFILEKFSEQTSRSQSDMALQHTHDGARAFRETFDPTTPSTTSKENPVTEAMSRIASSLSLRSIILMTCMPPNCRPNPLISFDNWQNGSFKSYAQRPILQLRQALSLKPSCRGPRTQHWSTLSAV